MRKGFTLIELLAVIVILAVVALIATPIIFTLVSDSKKSTYENSIDLYGKTIEDQIVSYQIGNQAIMGNLSTIDGIQLVKGDNSFKLDYSGNKIICNKIVVFEEGQVHLSECTINGSSIEYSYGPNYYENGTPIYFNVSDGQECTQSDYNSSYDSVTGEYLNSLTGYNGISKTSILQNSCLKFYAFNDTSSTKVNLILDHNTTASTTFSRNENVLTGNTLSTLKNDTSGWKQTERQKNYVFSNSNREYTIDYSDFNARLITAEEVVDIIGFSWDPITSVIPGEGGDFNSLYLETKSLNNSIPTNCNNTSVTACSYGWLYDRVSNNCENIGCLNNSNINLYGYWTATLAIDSVYQNPHISHIYNIRNSNVTAQMTWMDTDVSGVRPVISVLKSKLSN